MKIYNYKRIKLMKFCLIDSWYLKQTCTRSKFFFFSHENICVKELMSKELGTLYIKNRCSQSTALICWIKLALKSYKINWLNHRIKEQKEFTILAWLFFYLFALKGHRRQVFNSCFLSLNTKFVHYSICEK